LLGSRAVASRAAINSTHLKVGMLVARCGVIRHEEAIHARILGGHSGKRRQLRGMAMDVNIDIDIDIDIDIGTDAA